MRLRKLVVRVAMIAIPLTVMSTVAGVGGVWATATQGTGTFSCGNVGGRMTFNPPLKPHGTMAETVTIVFTANGCSGGKPMPKTVYGTVFLTFPMNTCRVPQLGSLSGHLSYVPKVERSDWVGGVELESTNGGSPTFSNFQNTTIEDNFIGISYPSSNFFSPPVWQFGTNFRPPHPCSTATITTAGFLGVLASF